MNSQDVIDINEEYVANYFHSIIGDGQDFLSQRIRHTFIENLDVLLSEHSNSDFYLHTNSFTVKGIKKKVIVHFLSHAMACAILQEFSVLAIPSACITAVISLIFDAERTIIKGRKEEIYLYLVTNKTVEFSMSVNALYDLLTDDLKEQINLEEFEEFLNTLVYAGLAIKDKNSNQNFLLFTKGEKKIRVHLSNYNPKE